MILVFDSLWTYWLYLGQFPSLDPSLRIWYSSTFTDPHSLCRGNPILTHGWKLLLYRVALLYWNTRHDFPWSWPTSVIGWATRMEVWNEIAQLSFISKYMLQTYNRAARVDSVWFSSVAQSCLTLCNPMDHSTPRLPVHHQLPEFTQTHVYWVSAAIQPPHPLSSPSPAFNLSQH